MKSLLAILLLLLGISSAQGADISGSELTLGAVTNVSTLTTASVSPVSGQLMILWFSTHSVSHTCSVTSVTGLNVTWTQISNDHDATPTIAIYAYRAVADGTTGAVTINWDTTCDRTTVYHLWAFTGVNTAVNQGVVAHHWDGAFNICSTCNLSSVISGFSSTNGVMSFGSGGGAGSSMTPTKDPDSGWVGGGTSSGGSGNTFYAGFVQFKPTRGSDNNSDMTLTFNASVAAVGIVDLELQSGVVRHRVNQE